MSKRIKKIIGMATSVAMMSSMMVTSVSALELQENNNEQVQVL